MRCRRSPARAWCVTERPPIALLLMAGGLLAAPLAAAVSSPIPSRPAAPATGLRPRLEATAPEGTAYVPTLFALLRTPRGSRCRASALRCAGDRRGGRTARHRGARLAQRSARRAAL